jgi:hypothetical protein
MKKIDGPNQVQDVGDLIMGPFGQEIDMFKGMEQTLSIANSEFKVMSFAEYAAEEKASGRKVGDGDLIAEYEDYKVESEQERSYVLEELNSELGDITRRDPRVIKADRKYGHYEFSSLQYDTEGETCSVLPYNWMCKVFNNKGEVICLTYGSLYVEVEQFCGCYDDVKYVADIESHQEISITSKYLEIS